MLSTPRELDAHIDLLRAGIARRKAELPCLERRAHFGPGYVREIADKRAALAYHEAALTLAESLRAEWGAT